MITEQSRIYRALAPVSLNVVQGFLLDAQEQLPDGQWAEVHIRPYRWRTGAQERPAYEFEVVSRVAVPGTTAEQDPEQQEQDNE